MWSNFKAWRQRRVLRRHPLPDALWQTTFDALGSLCAGLSLDEQSRLRMLSTLFVHDKAIYGARDLTVDLAMRLCVATQACLPLLALDAHWYADWDSVVLYPDTFIAPQRHIDAAGVVHVERQALIGEAWEAGPVVLAWSDVRCVDHGAAPVSARTGNVVIHECAHQIDQRNGAANGMPPLHPDMSRHLWTTTFGHAYGALCAAVEYGATHTALDPYGAQSPAEFFAVASESFFVRPGPLRTQEPALYQQLMHFYRQDPATRV